MDTKHNVFEILILTEFHMNKIFVRLSLLSLLALLSTSTFAGIQGRRTIYDFIGITNDTESNVLINQDRILKPGETVGIAQENLDKQTKKSIPMYIVNKQQTVTFNYFTYGRAQGLIAERLDGISVKITELLKKRINR